LRSRVPAATGEIAHRSRPAAPFAPPPDPFPVLALPCPTPNLTANMSTAHDLPQTRPPIDRMMRIHGELAAGKFPNCSTLARTIEVSTKTIQRDLEFMRDRWNLPLAYDERTDRQSWEDMKAFWAKVFR
jgi:hypothetical protein